MLRVLGKWQSLLQIKLRKFQKAKTVVDLQKMCFASNFSLIFTMAGENCTQNEFRKVWIPRYDPLAKVKAHPPCHDMKKKSHEESE